MKRLMVLWWCLLLLGLQARAQDPCANPLTVSMQGSSTGMPVDLSGVNAGSDQQVCGALTAVLAGSVPPFGTQGLWEVVSGTGSVNIVNSSLYNTGISVSAYGTYLLTWTVADGECSAMDWVQLEFFEEVTPAFAGEDQNICGTLATLTSAEPVLIGVGSWSQESGPGSLSFGNTLDPVTGVTAPGLGSFVLRWTVVNGTCSDFDEATFHFYQEFLAGSIQSGSTIICAGAIPGLISSSSPATGGNEDFEYRWQRSLDGINFTDIPDSDLASYQPEALTEDTWFRRMAKDGACSAFTLSDGTWLVEIADPIVIAIDGDDAICFGGNTTLTASGGVSYLWSTNETTAAITVAPVVTTLYSVTVTDVYNCTAISSVEVTVFDLPDAPLFTINENSGTPNDGIIFPGNPVEIGTVATYSAYLWDTGATTAVITVSPLVTSTYSVTITDNNGCTATNSVTITVDENAGPPVVICPDNIFVPTADCNCSARTVNFAPTVISECAVASIDYDFAPNSYLFPIGTTTVTVTVTDVCGSTATCSFDVTVGDTEKMVVFGNNVLIPNGSTATTSTNFTLLGSTAINNVITRTFQAEFVGCTPLEFVTPEAITISGTHAQFFSVLQQPTPSTLTTCGTRSNFMIRYDALEPGLHQALVTIESNDPANQPYTFVVEAATVSNAALVKGNSIAIPNGSVIPITNNNTDFGNINYGGSRTVTFAVFNNGTTALNLTGTPYVQLTGASAHLFEVTTQPSTPITHNQNRQFQIRFNGLEVGVHDATVVIPNDDPGANPYTYVIRATVLPPNFQVLGNNRPVPHGQTVPDPLNLTDFGTRQLGSGRINSFVARNLGPGILGLDGSPIIEITGPGADMFTVMTFPLGLIAVGNSSLFRIRYLPTASGEHFATVIIPSNDPLKDPYTFVVRGFSPEVDPRSAGEVSELELAEDWTMRVYPNPSSLNHIFIDLPIKKSGYEIEIIDAHGKTFLKQKLIDGGESPVDISGVPPGFYLIRSNDPMIPPVRFVRM